MRLTAILQPECVKVPLVASDKQGAISELVELLAAKTGLSAQGAADLKQAVWQREQMRTTGIGCGVGIPHGKSAGCAGLRMAIGRAANPIEYGAIDGRPVQLIILLVSAPDQTGPHIQALASISRLLTDENFRNALKKAASASDLYRLIAEQEAKMVTA